VNPNLYKLTSDYENQIFSKGINPYADWNEPLGVYIFNDPAHNSSGLFLGTGETPRYAVPSEYAASYANVELASLVMNANTLVINALAERMTSVKGCLADPFIHALYGHAHQNEIEGIGYNNNMGGFIIGIDDVLTFSNEKYLRLGAVFGYIHGKTNFFGSATGPEKSAKHNVCSLTLFGAYESFNDKNLKTNIGVTLGYCHGKDSLSRTDPDCNNFDGKIRSNSAFLGLEFVKNLYAHKGYNFGLWCRANYSRIAQKGYDESSSATTGAQHVSAINHNFLTTVVGINIEKEIFNQEYADKKLTLSLKAGWESQIMRKHSDATASFDNNLGIGEFSPTLGSPSRNAAIVSIGASQKLNVNWSITGSYVARFNKDISTHNLSCGAEYSF
jgi:outer membrane autotransporter protein